MLRRVVVSGLSTCLLALTFSFTHSSNAQAASIRLCWIDGDTGQAVNTYPQGTEAGFDPNHRHRPLSPGGFGGQNFVRNPDGSWINGDTGQAVNTYPQGTEAKPGDPKHRHRPLSPGGFGGQNFVLVPCPPPTQTSGLYLGGGLLKNSGRVGTTETAATTGAVTNQFSDSGDPIGAGIVAGYNFAPWNNNIIVGPFVSVDWLKQTINHTFAGGTFLGTTTHWIINAGVKAGVVTSPGVFVYGLAGAAWLNQDLNVNFATAAGRNTTTPGFTLGLGGEYQPSSWQLFGKPVSMFLQYQHTWYSTANFNMPTSSPGFNYAFKRTDDTIKLGVNVYLSR